MNEEPSKWDDPVSWSKATTYDFCPRQFKFQYVDEIEEEEDVLARDDGINFHEYMDQYYDDPPEEPTERHAVDLAKGMFDGDQQARYHQWIRNWHDWNVHLYETWGPEYWVPDYTEARIEEVIDGVEHHAYVDRIQWDPDSGEWGVIDYKPQAKSSSRYKGQVAYYGDILLEVADLLDETPTWGGIYGYKQGIFKRWDIHWASTRASKKKIDRLVDLENGYEPDFGMHCDYCDYMDECMQLEAENEGLLGL